MVMKIGGFGDTDLCNICLKIDRYIEIKREREIELFNIYDGFGGEDRWVGRFDMRFYLINYKYL
jgi:hypothetical protein